ncbi:MAG: YlmH/Sll1252 family protein [Acutalibacteraceae bacterium]
MEGSILRAYISENIEKAQRENIPSAVSKFLDSASLSAASALARSTAGRFIFWGGFEGAERVVMLSVPDYIGSDDPNEIFTVYADGCPLSAVRVEKDRFSDIGHRDYLGAVMGLGLTRESVGDICVQPDGCDIIALPNAAKYIEDNLTGAGRATLKAKQNPARGSPCAAGKYKGNEHHRSIAATRRSSGRDILALAFGGGAGNSLGRGDGKRRAGIESRPPPLPQRQNRPARQGQSDSRRGVHADKEGQSQDRGQKIGVKKTMNQFRHAYYHHAHYF